MENRYGVLDKLQVTVLVEDYAGYDSDLLAQHGVCFLLETEYAKGKKTILFDAGQSAGPVLNNMEKLSKNPDDVDLVFLSHCHNDHTGGLAGFLAASSRSRIPVIAHPEIYRSNFAVKPDFRTFGMSPENSPGAVMKAGGELLPIADSLPLAPGILTTGEIRERAAFEKKPTLTLLTLQEGKMVRDLMTDDISLIFILNQGLVIVTGCSHAGIISILQTAVSITGINHVAAVIGGFHLIDAGGDRVRKTVEEMKTFSVDKIYTGHCTGLKAEAGLLQEYGSSFKKLRTGLTIEF